MKGGLRVLLFVFSILALIHMPNLHAFSPTGSEGECQKCHKLTHEDVKGILKNLKKSQVEVLDIQLSPLKGLWEISIEEKGKRGIFYVDFSQKYIIPGPIIETKSGTNKTQENLRKLRESQRIDFSRIPLANALVMGNSKSPYKVAVFTNPD